MHPVLVDFGNLHIMGKAIPIVIGGYGLMFALGIVSGWFWFRRLGREIDPRASWTDLYFLTILAGFLGAKAANLVLFLPDLLSGRRAFLGVLGGGGVWLGGVIAGLLTISWQARRLRISRGRLLNLCFVAVPFGHAVGRIGCLLGGCCYGTACALPWAVTYTDPLASKLNGTPLHVALHPTALYESILEFVNFGICYALWRRRAPDWTVAAAWMGLYGAQRFVLEFFRDDPRGRTGPLSPSQWTAVVMVGCSLLILWLALAKRERSARG